MKNNEHGNMALEITLLLAMMAAVIVFLMPVVAPFYNNGSGMPTGDADLGWINTWTIGGINNAIGSMGSTPSMWDYAGLLLALTIAAIVGIALIIITVVIAIPAMILIFHIPLAMASVLQVAIYFTYLVFWLQIKNKGFSWDQYR